MTTCHSVTYILPVYPTHTDTHPPQEPPQLVPFLFDTLGSDCRASYCVFVTVYPLSGSVIATYVYSVELCESGGTVKCRPVSHYHRERARVCQDQLHTYTRTHTYTHAHVSIYRLTVVTGHLRSLTSSWLASVRVCLPCWCT